MPPLERRRTDVRRRDGTNRRVNRRSARDLQLTDLLSSDPWAASEIERRCRRILWSKFGTNPMACAQLDDLVQEVLMAAVKQAKKLASGRCPPIKNVDAWLCRVTLNAVWHTWRREGEGRNCSLDASDKPALPAPETLPLTERLAIRQALCRLDAGSRQLLWQRDVVGEGRQVMAERLGITSNAMGVRLHRCRKRLFKLYESSVY